MRVLPRARVTHESCMPSPSLAALSLDKTASSISKFSTLRGLPEELALALFERVLAKQKLTEHSLRLFLDLVEEGRAREAAGKRAEPRDDGGDLFAEEKTHATTASFDNDLRLDHDANADANGADANDLLPLYSSLARRIASLRLQLPPPVVPTGTGRWLGDLPPPWK